MARIGFVGTGEIAAAMVRGLTGQGHKVFVSERSAARAASLAAEFAEVSVADNQSIVDCSDIVCLCLMADVAREVLPSLTFRSDQRVISAMVDVDLAALASLCAPASDICITIPMPFIAQGGCPLPVFPESAALREVFGERNLILRCESESAMNAHFAASSLCSGLFTQMRAGAEWLGGVTGDAEAAETYVAALLSGYLNELPKDGKGRFSEALQALSTEGGLNATLRAHLEDAGMLDVLVEGLDSFRGRLGLPGAR
ncbi:MAG: NAD(P)-binding domain-containing protein [Rhodobacteraceae bacterium]|nr:NAD(P)-binding domain-containing protein [Paracoccaceae bacterium]